MLKIKLRELGSFKNGVNFSKNAYGKGIKIINVKDLFKSKFVNFNNLDEIKKGIIKNEKDYIVENNDILFTRSSLVRSGAGLVNIVSNLKEKILFCGFIIRFRPNTEKILPEYLFYLLRSPKYRKLFTNLTSQTNISNLSQSILGNIEIDLIDTNYQQKIASVLSALDEKIELNNKINEELEKMAKLLYDYWFVQFDFPDKNGRPYKSSGGKMVWNEKLKREIPEGWEVENLFDNSLTRIIKPGINFFEGEKTYIATSDLNENQINFFAKKITFVKKETRANMEPKYNSVWFAKMMKTKKTIYFGDYSDFFINQFILSTGFLGLECKKNYYLEYIWNFINNYEFENTKDKLASGSVQLAINNESLKFILFIRPKEEILVNFHKKTYFIYKKIYSNQIENFILTQLRDWLLPMLMNGQVVVG